MTMSVPHAAAVEDWTELDALVDAELDMVLSRRAKPVSEPEAEEAAFMVEASAFLARHPEPQRLIAQIVARFPAPVFEDPAVEGPPASDEPEEARDEPA
jgi:hypothetical protein